MATFDEREKSRHGGQPVFGYFFTSGAKQWRFTGADTHLALPTGEFLQETIGHSEIEFSQEASAHGVRITVPRTNPVAALFIPGAPDDPVSAIIYGAHRGDEASALPVFIGQVGTALFDGSEVELQAAPISRVFEQQFPARVVGIQCQHFVYDEGCGVDPNDYLESITVTTVSGVEIVSNDLLLHGSGYYDNGKVTHPVEGPRFITSHVGNKITIKNPFRTLASLDVLTILPGCNRLARGSGDCRFKFTVANPSQGNVLRHAGFFAMPSRNPHTSGLGGST